MIGVGRCVGKDTLLKRNGAREEEEEEEEEEAAAAHRNGEEERCEGAIVFYASLYKKLLFTRFEDPAFRSVLVFIYFCHRRNRFGFCGCVVHVDCGSNNKPVWL